MPPSKVETSETGVVAGKQMTVPLDTQEATSEMIFPANHLA